MKTAKRDKQKMMFIVLIICFIVALVLSVVSSKFKNTENPTTATENTQIATSDNIVSNDLITEDETLVTGSQGENDTLVPATFNKVVSEKVIEVTVNDETKQIAMIGVEVKAEQQASEIEYLNEILQPNQQLWLQYDEATINEEGQDLCYIWLSDEVSLYTYTSCEKYMLQGVLISKDLAEPIEEYPNSRYEVNFRIMSGD